MPAGWDTEPLEAMWAGPGGWGGAGGSTGGMSFADLLQKIAIGSKEETGFPEESTKNPIGFQPPSQTVPGDPVSQAGAH